MTERTLKDSLGTLKLTGESRWGAATARAMLAHAGGIRPLHGEPEFLRALIEVKKVCALANADAGVLTPAMSIAITGACDNLLGESFNPADFPVDVLLGGGSVAVNMNVNEVIAAVAAKAGHNVDAKLHVNASQSTADVCHTAVRIAVGNVLTQLVPKLEQVSRALAAKGKEFSGTTTLGRTCLRDAATIDAGAGLDAAAQLIQRRTDTLKRSAPAMRVVNLGGTVIGTGSGAPAAFRSALPQRLAEVFGPPVTIKANLVDAAQHSDDLGATLAELGQLARALLRVARDIRLLGSGPGGGFNEITGKAVMEGSSFFPGKVNPILEESIIQAAIQVVGEEAAGRMAVEYGELNLNVFDTQAGLAVIRAMKTLLPAVTSWGMLGIPGLTLNRERCRELSAMAHPEGRAP